MSCALTYCSAVTQHQPTRVWLAHLSNAAKRPVLVLADLHLNRITNWAKPTASDQINIFA